MVDAYSCGGCGAEETKCHHIDPKKPVEFYEHRGQLYYRNVHGVKPFELSAVEDPAYPSAAHNPDWAMTFNG
jgi:hypothetical protein